MLGAAAALLDRGDAEVALIDALEMATKQIAGAEAAFDGASQFFDDASERVDEFLGATSGDFEPAQLVDSSGTRLRDAKLTLRDLPPRHDEVEQLKTWLGNLQQRRETLATRLDRYGVEPT